MPAAMQLRALLPSLNHTTHDLQQTHVAAADTMTRQFFQTGTPPRQSYRLAMAALVTPIQSFVLLQTQACTADAHHSSKSGPVVCRTHMTA
jgi:hypothetical protein